MNFFKKALHILVFPIRYSVQKFTKSWNYLHHNLSEPKKEAGRHLLRIILTVTGTTVGGTYGSFYGALFGTLFIPVPFLGTIVGTFLGCITGMALGAMTGALTSKMMTKIGMGAKHLLLSLIGGYQDKPSPVNPFKPVKYEPNPAFEEKAANSSHSQTVTYSTGREGEGSYNAKDLHEILQFLYQEKRKNKKKHSLLAQLSGVDTSQEDKDVTEKNEQLNCILHDARNLINLTYAEKASSPPDSRPWRVYSVTSTRARSPRYFLTFKSPEGTAPAEITEESIRGLSSQP